MQGLRKYALVVSLSTAIVLGSAATTTPTTPAPLGSLDGSIITQILEFFGIELQGRISIPPG